MAEIGKPTRSLKLQNEAALRLVLVLRAVGNALGKVSAFARSHVAVVGLAHTLERHAKLVKRVPVAGRAITFAVHEPGEVHVDARDAGIERKGLCQNLPFASDRLLNQGKVGDAHDCYRARHAFLLGFPAYHLRRASAFLAIARRGGKVAGRLWCITKLHIDRICTTSISSIGINAAFAVRTMCCDYFHDRRNSDTHRDLSLGKSHAARRRFGCC